MANQKDITLRDGHADPKTIVLRDLPVADVVTTTIFIYPGEASAKDITLRDPTTVGAADTSDDLIATGITTTPDITSATLTQQHVLTATGVTSTPDIAPATLTQRHVLTATGITATPTVGSPALSVTHVLAATGITATPDVSAPALTQQHGLAATGVASTPDITAATLTQAHVLAANGLATTPYVSQATLTQTHNIAGAGLTITPVVGNPALSESGADHNLVAVNLSLGAPVVGLPDLTSGEEEELGGAQFGPIHRLRRRKGLKYVKAKSLTDAIREALDDIETRAERAQAKVETELREQEESERLIKAAGDAAYADAYAKGLEDAKAAALEAGKDQADAIRKEYEAAVVEAERAQERLRATEAQEDDDEAMFVIMQLLEAA